jgi:hypothetical protein
MMPTPVMPKDAATTAAKKEETPARLNNRGTAMVSPSMM